MAKFSCFGAIARKTRPYIWQWGNYSVHSNAIVWRNDSCDYRIRFFCIQAKNGTIDDGYFLYRLSSSSFAPIRSCVLISITYTLVVISLRWFAFDVYNKCCCCCCCCCVRRYCRCLLLSCRYIQLLGETVSRTIINKSPDHTNVCQCNVPFFGVVVVVAMCIICKTLYARATFG